jgi:hypothetical protein
LEGGREVYSELKKFKFNSLKPSLPDLFLLAMKKKKKTGNENRTEKKNSIKILLTALAKQCKFLRQWDGKKNRVGVGGGTGSEGVKKAGFCGGEYGC